MGIGAGPYKHQTDPRYHRKPDIAGTWLMHSMSPRNVPMTVLVVEIAADGGLQGTYYSEHEPQSAQFIQFDGRYLTFGVNLGTDGNEYRRIALQWVSGDFLMPVPPETERVLTIDRVPIPEEASIVMPPGQDYERLEGLLGKDRVVYPGDYSHGISSMIGYKYWADYSPINHVRDLEWYKWRGYAFEPESEPEFEYRLGGCELTREDFDK